MTFPTNMQELQELWSERRKVRKDVRHGAVIALLLKHDYSMRSMAEEILALQERVESLQQNQVPDYNYRDF